MVIAGKYEVSEILDQGGRGVVYKVRHTEFHTLLAVKVLPPHTAEDQEFVDRFREEALKNYHLSNPHKRHPNIVQVQDVDFDESLNAHYYVMEYIQGKTVAHCLEEQGPFPLPRILTIARKVGEALAYAHTQPRPVIHRDISPSNIMIEERSERVVVMDFGVAKELGEKDRTKAGVVIGDPKYCAPEQVRHEPLSGAADIYSLGMVVYEMYTGRQFFTGLQPEEVVNKVLDDTEENIPSFSSPPPPEFVSLVTKSIAKSRTHRYQRMEEFLHDVEVCRVALELTPVTILIPPPSKKRDNEDWRRRLEEEQRQLTLGLQGKAREARERAEQAGAAEWAATFLQQGQEREAEGEKRWEERNYPLAQDAYEQASQFFLRAEETANETVRQGTEQVRTEMATAKAAAERYRGQEKARNFYASGLSFEREARQLWEQKRYRQAKEVYGKARDSFADARDLAYATLQGEAEAERQRVEEAKTAAQTEGAAELATDLFEQAQRSEEQDAVSQFAALQRQERESEKISPQSTPKTSFLSSSWSRRFPTSMKTILRQKTRLLLFVGLGLLAVTGKYLFDRSAAPHLTNPSVPENQAEVPHHLPEPDPQRTAPQLPPTVPWQITRATPDPANELVVSEGQPLSFAVEAEGGKGEALQYLWLLDGKEKAKGKKWTYRPDFTEGGDTPKQVTLLVTDEANHKAEKTWRVLVANKDRPPRIASVSPHIDPIEISPGETTDFSVTAMDPDRDDRLLYIWALNGQEVARGDDRRQFHAPPSASPYQVTVTVIDQDGQKDQMDWRAIIKAPSLAPRLVSFQPSEDKVSTRVGQPLDFSVTTALPKGVQKQLRYQWNMEGASSTTTATGNRRLIFDTPGIYRLTVLVVDSEGLQSSPKRWIVEVQK